MKTNKIIRTICQFARHPSLADIDRLVQLEERFTAQGFTVQTQRLCTPDPDAAFELDAQLDGSVFLSMGRLDFPAAMEQFDRFMDAKNVAFNLDLTDVPVLAAHVDLLQRIIAQKPGKTFSFAYTFNNVPSSPYFPSAMYERDGFAVGLQPTDLAENCETLEDWFESMHAVWQELDVLMAGESDFLGIDTSVAPLFEGPSSFFEFMLRLHPTLFEAVTSDSFIRISEYIKQAWPRTIGLCGLMFPCLEDFELADAYARGEFSIERNIFLSLHSGLGIDTYPIGIDEDPDRILDVLRLVQGLSNKYRKPLSARFISDGVSRIGEMAHFNNMYLKDVVIRKL